MFAYFILYPIWVVMLWKQQIAKRDQITTQAVYHVTNNSNVIVISYFVFYSDHFIPGFNIYWGCVMFTICLNAE